MMQVSGLKSGAAMASTPGAGGNRLATSLKRRALWLFVKIAWKPCTRRFQMFAGCSLHRCRTRKNGVAPFPHYMYMFLFATPFVS